MTRINITEKIWYDSEVKSYIMLDVTDEISSQRARVVDNVELLPKDEYHVSLVPASKLSEDASVVQDVVQDVTQFLRENPGVVVFEGLGEERYVCRKDGEVTMIAPAIIIGVESLRQVVRQHIPGYAPAFPHVTLLKSANSPYGIGVNSEDDLQQMCERLDIKGG